MSNRNPFEVFLSDKKEDIVELHGRINAEIPDGINAAQISSTEIPTMNSLQLRINLLENDLAAQKEILLKSSQHILEMLELIKGLSNDGK